MKEIETKASLENEFVPENALYAPYHEGIEVDSSDFQICKYKLLCRYYK
jgi:hypothetical protein